MKYLILLAALLFSSCHKTGAATLAFGDPANPQVHATLAYTTSYDATLSVTNDSTTTITLAAYGNPAPYAAGYSFGSGQPLTLAPGCTATETVYYWGQPSNLTFLGGRSDGGGVYLASIPEPGVVLLGSLGLGLLLKRRRP